MTFVPACNIADLPDDGLASIEVRFADETLPLMVGCRSGEWVAYLNICPHQGRMLNYAPNRFLLKEDQVICAAHGAVFNLDDGLCTAGPCKGSALRPVPVEVRSGVVHVALPESPDTSDNP